MVPAGIGSNEVFFINFALHSPEAAKSLGITADAEIAHYLCEVAVSGRIAENMYNRNQFPIQQDKASGNIVVKNTCPPELISVIEVVTTCGLRMTMFRRERSDVFIPDFVCLHCSAKLRGGFDICSSCLQPVTTRGKGQMDDMRRYDRNRLEGRAAVSDKSGASRHVRRALSYAKSGGHTRKYDTDAKYRGECQHPDNGPQVPRILWFERLMSNGQTKWINADTLKFGGYLVDMRTSECPKGMPARDDDIAWKDGVLTAAEKVAKPPKPEAPPPIGSVKFDGSFIQWFDLEGQLHSTETREAVEVSEEPVTGPMQADDAYVAQKDKQHAMMKRAVEAAAKKAAASKDDGWRNWDGYTPSSSSWANSPKPSSAPPSSSSGSWTNNPGQDRKRRVTSWNDQSWKGSNSSKDEWRWGNTRR